MDIFNLLTLIGGLSLFLFGMAIMGQALERRAGVELRSLLGKFTTNKMAGLLTGAGVTTVIPVSYTHLSSVRIIAPQRCSLAFTT